jgi:hypothetical protein
MAQSRNRTGKCPDRGQTVGERNRVALTLQVLSWEDKIETSRCARQPEPPFLTPAVDELAHVDARSSAFAPPRPTAIRR